LAVDRNVLIPRPETEILVERVINEIGDEECNILDLGTGSGAIAITLAKKTKGKVYASDISIKALEVAKNNAKKHKADIIFKEGDLLIPWEGYTFDIIVANLPYVPHEDMDSLAPDLIRYEPKEALDGGYGGVEIYKKMFAQLTNVLAGKGIIYCEIGAGQGNILKKELEFIFPNTNASIIKDYSGTDRILRAELFPK
jgi:release factor glutamine methyltransferase